MRKPYVGRAARPFAIHGIIRTPHIIHTTLFNLIDNMLNLEAGGLAFEAVLNFRAATPLALRGSWS